MDGKCFYNDFGFCKFGDQCRLDHPIQVCRETSCRKRDCPKRHPKACRNFFLKNHCRFGNICKYDHFFDCKICANLKHVIELEAKNTNEKLDEKDEAIERLAKEIEHLKNL